MSTAGNHQLRRCHHQLLKRQMAAGVDAIVTGNVVKTGGLNNIADERAFTAGVAVGEVQSRLGGIDRWAREHGKATLE
jgi:hypothetical protein